MSVDWQFIGSSPDNDGVATLLNNEGVGKVAAVSITLHRDAFTVWANEDNQITLPGYVWKALGEDSTDEGVANLLQEHNAAGGAVSVNIHGRYVVWGYIKS